MSLQIWLPPALSVAFLAMFAAILWPLQERSTKDKGQPTREHSERIYRVFEFFVTVSLAIVAGLGYLRLESPSHQLAAMKQGMTGLRLLELAVGTTLSLFVIIHQGSKLRRWKDVEWAKLPLWLELWMCILMMSISTGIWVVAGLW